MDEDKRTTAAARATTALTTKGKSPTTRGASVPGWRLVVWILVCVSVFVVSFLLAVLIWTLVSYHETLMSLQQRVERLELDNVHINRNLDTIVKARVDKILHQRRREEAHKAVKRSAPDNCQCPPGRAGLPGPRGLKGEAGNMGSKGVNGFPGPIGPPGKPGDPGSSGPKGDKGDMGEDGLKGDKGDTGLPGFDGMAGAPGQKGDRGPPGLPAGLEAGEWEPKIIQLKGEPGQPGPAGPQGQHGPPGLPGFDGVPGPPGEKGPEGPPGPEGPKGDPGRPGESSGSPFRRHRTCRLEVKDISSVKKKKVKRRDGKLVVVGEEVAHAVDAVAEDEAMETDAEAEDDEEENEDVQVIIDDCKGPPGPPGPVATIDGPCKCEKGDRGKQGKRGRRGKRGSKGSKGEPGIPGLDVPCPLDSNGFPVPGCGRENRIVSAPPRRYP